MRARIVIGMIFATLAMCTSGVVEIYRQRECGLIPRSQEIGTQEIQQNCMVLLSNYSRKNELYLC